MVREFFQRIFTDEAAVGSLREKIVQPSWASGPPLAGTGHTIRTQVRWRLGFIGVLKGCY